MVTVSTRKPSKTCSPSRRDVIIAVLLLLQLGQLFLWVSMDEHDELTSEEHKRTRLAHPPCNMSVEFKVEKIRKCRHVFIDLGSNVGDALHKFIDSFLPPIKTEGQLVHYVFNTTTEGRGPETYGSNGGQLSLLPTWVHEKVTAYNNQHRHANAVCPENYCFYGVEGNPYFTPILRELELNLLHMQPRPPVRHVHFLTETVASGKGDGPTSLYLDTTNTRQNFWGSSLLPSHADVIKSSIRSNNRTTTAAAVNVQGITLTSLLEQVVDTEIRPGGHVMIKIDVEGAEYELLEEAITSGVLCKLGKEQGFRIDILNEFHHDNTIGSAEPRQRWETVVHGEEKLKECGVGYKHQKSWIPTW